jgi:peptide-methionine (S)-S-oxide reductase
VIRTRVGYAGGSTPDPTYRRLGDHTETLQIDFDPARIAYARLLDLFWQSHRADRRPGSRQYRSAIFYHDESQRRQADASKMERQAHLGRDVYTAIEPLDKFYRAEDYHQKYYLRGHTDIMREFKAIYPESRDFVDATSAARANGYLGGNGTPAQLKREIELLGLSPGASRTLLNRFEAFGN